tara:strand:- start:3764 stop:3988 length:225 start_codon:yes stop_codon:yes gene_type:complete
MNKLEKIKKIINKIQSENDIVITQKINIKSSLVNDLGLDSIMLAQLTVEIEDEFGVDIFEDSIVSSISEILEKL